MKQKIVKLAKNFSLPAIEYASQANAVLGIRDSGKTYTAMKAAEELQLANIPIIVYDPVGVWKNIRVGVNGKKGFPVIVAGGDKDADITLTPDNAVQIVRAAMKAGVSLIIDLYSPSLANKSKWIKIVQETVDVLMYENRDHGLRHIFIEEAAEFIPQRVQPQQGKVYSSIERVARMGRNASLGMTIINQRAEEVNKAILELCALVFLHKQTGKNSLTSIKKWLDIMGVEARGQIVANDLPKLKQGECVVVDTNSEKWFEEIKILPKQTFHPSPEKGVPVKAAKSNANISEFVKKLKSELNKAQEKPKEKNPFVKYIKHDPNPSVNLNKSDRDSIKTINDLTKSNEEYKKQLSVAVSEITTLTAIIAEFNRANGILHAELARTLSFRPIPSKVKIPKEIIPTKNNVVSNNNIPQRLPSTKPVQQPPPSTYSSNAKSDSAINRMIKGVSMFQNGISKQQLAILCGMSVNSGTFGVYYRRLRSEEVIAEYDGKLHPLNGCISLAANMTELKTNVDDLLLMWYGILGESSGITRILKAVAECRYSYETMEQIGEDAGMSSSSGTFGVYYRKLKRLGLVIAARKQLCLSPDFIMPETPLIENEVQKRKT